MRRSSRETVIGLLHRIQDGDRAAFDELLPLLYAELHVLAHRQRSRWKGDYTLITTALVHEAYLKLVNQKHGRLEKISSAGSRPSIPKGSPRESH